MLNALEPGTVMPVHRHHGSSETVVILRGKIQWVFFDDNGNETERVTLDANGEPRMLNVERDRWHSLVCLESGSVLYESKDGPYRPLGEEEVMGSWGNEERKVEINSKMYFGFLLFCGCDAEGASIRRMRIFESKNSGIYEEIKIVINNDKEYNFDGRKSLFLW